MNSFDFWEGISVIYCCITSHPKTLWLKTTINCNFSTFLWVRSSRGVRLSGSTLGSFMQTERAVGILGGEVQLRSGWPSLSSCTILRSSLCGPYGLVWASSKHGGLRTVRLFTWLPRVPTQVSQLVKKKLNHPLWKPQRVTSFHYPGQPVPKAYPMLRGGAQTPPLNGGDIL